MTLLRTHHRFLMLLALFALAVIVHQSVLPPLEGSDEILHYTYVEWLRAENRLPDRLSIATNCTRQESGQPPLTYAVGALLLNLLNVPTVDCDQAMQYSEAITNPWKNPMVAWNRVDNVLTFLPMPDVEGYPQDTINNAVGLLRWINLPLGIIAVIGAYGAALEVFRRRSWALVSAAVFAFMPMLVHLTAYWNNDVPAIAFASLIVWTTLCLLGLGASPRRLFALGLLFGLGGLCKVSVFLLLPAVALAVLLDWRNRKLSFIQLIVNGFLLALPVALLFGPWVLYGLLTYHDPIGFETHTFAYDSPLTLPQTASLIPEMYLTYLGKFEFSKIYLHPVTYTAIGLLGLLSVLGYGAVYLSRPSSRWLRAFWNNLRAQQAAVLSVMILVVALGFYNWMRQLYFVTGRLMYPAHVPITLAIVGGLYLLARRWPRLVRGIQGCTIGVLAVAGLILPTVLIHSATTPVLLTRDQLPPLQGTPVDFDQTIRFLGYQQPSRIISEPIYTLDLCWEVLKTPTRSAAFSLKLIHDGEILADRTSLHGMSRYNGSLWQPGAIFCDQVDIRIDDPDLVDEPPPQPAQVYDVLLVLLDAQTQRVDWAATTPDGQPIEFPIITQAVVPAGDKTSVVADTLSRSSLRFPGFADLTGFSLDSDLVPGASLNLYLLWHVTGAVSQSWSLFIHLYGPDGAVTLADGIPRAGNYPTWGWSPGEYVFDRWPLQLPDSLPSGDYELRIGFYRQDTEERMPVTVDGAPAPDNSAVLLYFSVP
jgi:hypothetical protein